jgi:hypothetical protein
MFNTRVAYFETVAYTIWILVHTVCVVTYFLYRSSAIRLSISVTSRHFNGCTPSTRVKTTLYLGACTSFILLRQLGLEPEQLTRNTGQHHPSSEFKEFMILSQM